MGERKGQLKWYPPDWKPEHGNLNKYHGTHALRERARKLHQGILIIRFELPYNIWCEGCENHIGMGVRYNAEKSKVGMYYTTPIWKFRMKCHLCDNHFEIQTDPANLDYVILNGARRQERRFDPTENGQVVAEEKATIAKLATDAMFKLEHGEADKVKGKALGTNLAKLEDVQEVFRDDYEANAILRKRFRASKKERLATETADNALRKKSSISIPLMAVTQEDNKLAKLIKLKSLEDSDAREKRKLEGLASSSIFPKSFKAVGGSSRGFLSTPASSSSSGSSSSSSASSDHRLRLKLGCGNSSLDGVKRQKGLILGVKTKRRKSNETFEEVGELSAGLGEMPKGEGMKELSASNPKDLEEMPRGEKIEELPSKGKKLEEISKGKGIEGSTSFEKHENETTLQPAAGISLLAASYGSSSDEDSGG
ncbi:unnamed protein product [Cyprideis torosa]|uniref:Uncharacterized protein n=1 Tax=Cyprideis torosa TaxID=163714 RepID=A0A7R8ZSH2_9CRUS|nr:unnamed protein product [Cyprideis torosa]CAG0896033.1 unnamed protein product [Cyprideis torosa]